MSNITDFNTHLFDSVDTNMKSSYCNAQEQELNDLSEFLKLEQNKYLHQKILYDLIEEALEEDHMETELKIKIKDIILSENVKQTLDLRNSEGKDKLLGISDSNTLLTYTESSSLRDLLKEKLTKNVHNIIESHSDWTELMESNKSLGLIQLPVEDMTLLDYKNKLAVEQEKYIMNLLKLQELLEEISDKRVIELPGIMTQKIQECKIEEKLNHLKCILSQQKCKVDIFTETNCTLKAYKELIRGIIEQQNDCQKEIEKLLDLKQKYDQVSGKQFDDILKPYLLYKSSLEKKKVLYNSLK
ncbi:uncharacterized protein LOC130902155 [Diorhabda carinulata]|uniref:uncharacterized protein LOC130902155 n=1 Tax=Diorhabda carinulata TaxID=1163345 RepID=UPI0025A1F322|nr:uncharacterized protein LOC130902155 [Diorhabda carinulata]